MKKILTFSVGVLLFAVLLSCNLSKLFEKKEAPCEVTCDATASTTSGTAPLSVVFMANATVTGCTQPAVYSWDFGDQGFSTSRNTSHSYNSPGTYLWTMTATAGTARCVKSGAITVEKRIIYSQDDGGDYKQTTSGGGTAGLGVKLVTNLRTGVFRVKINNELKAEHSFSNSQKNLKSLKKFMHTKDSEWAKEFKVPAGDNKIKLVIEDNQGSRGTKVVPMHFKAGQHHALRVVVRGAPGDMRVEVIE